MNRFTFLLQPCMAFVTAVSLSLVSSPAYGERLLDESFENFDANDDPIGWDLSGHPNYIRVSNESEENWDTPYGEYALQTYSTGATANKTLRTIPNLGSDGDGDYTVTFNVSSSATRGEYRAELWVFDYSLGTYKLLASTVGDTDGSKDFSFTDQITWRYNYADHLVGGFSTIEGGQLQLRLGQDPDRENWRHTPLWDNVTVDYLPDLDLQEPEMEDITDDNEGSLIVATNTVVTYTVIFNEAMNPATVDSSDFGNAGSADATIQSVTAGPNNLVFTVEVVPTSEGTLRLKINEGAILEDTQGNALDTTTLTIQDTTNFNVEPDIPTILPSDFVDDQGGGPIAENTLVTYTLTFSEDMDDTTVTAVDFGNAGTAAIDIGTITETSPGVFTVEVTPTTSGSLQFRINSGVTLESAAGEQLNTSSAIADDTIITVDSVPPLLTEIKDDAAGSPVAVNSLLTYEVFFSEDMDLSTIDASDFGNAISSGAAPFTINSVEEASPGLIRMEVTPTGTGSIQLQVNAGAVLLDTIGNALDTTSAITDATTITVEAASTDPYDSWSGGTAPFGDDANGDGVSNGLAWLLGASDVNEDALQYLPGVSVNASGDLILSFRVLKTANRGSAVAKVQYSNDLGASDLWTNNEAEVPDTDATVNGIVFDTTDAGDYVDVTATIPASAAGTGGKLFGRFIGEMP